MHICVPRRFVGRLIGRQTANIQSVIDKSGVSHIHFNDHPAGPPSPSPAGTDDAVIANGVSGNRFPLIISYETHQAWETWLEAHFMKQFLGDGAHKSPPALPAGVPPPPAPPPLGYRHNILIRVSTFCISVISQHLQSFGIRYSLWRIIELRSVLTEEHCCS
ncbi:unnamed protein product [Protopolystoma xenopodis]|uniref:K Homology domain-containing protein n=1 Tax=Protopolystoma xenopodis TaxID=117903 RepID=A0A3S5AGF1_9PLAT|nr:unnamed protein product [Protopolystoma xenopodis]